MTDGISRNGMERAAGEPPQHDAEAPSPYAAPAGSRGGVTWVTEPTQDPYSSSFETGQDPSDTAPVLPDVPPPLEEEVVLQARGDGPARGWRSWLYNATGGRINLDPERQEREWSDHVERCLNPCPTGRRVAVISRKGGVGKTTTTLMLGHTLASIRQDRVIAIDGNPDAGTLGHRIKRQTTATVVDALDELESLTGYPSVRALTSQAPSRLEVLASPEDPHASAALRGVDYQHVLDVLSLHYNLMLCDTGTGIIDDANLGILNAVDQIVVVTGPALDTARAASLTLDWLETNGRAELVTDAVVVVNGVGELGRIEIDTVLRHFAARCRSVCVTPHDPHLDAGGIVDPDRLAPATQEAWLMASAEVADGFSLAARRGKASFSFLAEESEQR